MQTLWKGGVQAGVPQKKGILWHYSPFFVNFTYEYDKFPTKKGELPLCTLTVLVLKCMNYCPKACTINQIRCPCCLLINRQYHLHMCASITTYSKTFLKIYFTNYMYPHLTWKISIIKLTYMHMWCLFICGVLLLLIKLVKIISVNLVVTPLLLERGSYM